MILVVVLLVVVGAAGTTLMMSHNMRGGAVNSFDEKVYSANAELCCEYECHVPQVSSTSGSCSITAMDANKETCAQIGARRDCSSTEQVKVVTGSFKFRDVSCQAKGPC